MDKKQIDYINQYKKDHYKRVVIEYKKDKYSVIKAAADRAGTSVNGYIKNAVDEKIKRDDDSEID